MSLIQLFHHIKMLARMEKLGNVAIEFVIRPDGTVELSTEEEE